MTRRVHLTPGAWWRRPPSIRIRTDRRTLAELEEAWRQAARAYYTEPCAHAGCGVPRSEHGDRVRMHTWRALQPVGHWPNGSTREWRAARLRVLKRDGYVCQLQIPEKCIGTATHAHHTQDRDVVGDDERFIVAACAPCNIHVGDPTLDDPEPLPDW